MIRHNRPAKLRNIAFKIDEVLGLLSVHHIVKVDVFVTPLEVVNDSLVSQLFLHNEQILEKLNDSLVHVVVVEFSNHDFLVFQGFLVLVDQSVALVNHRSDVLELIFVKARLDIVEGLLQSLVLAFFALQLVEHGFYLVVVALELAQNEILVLSLVEFGLYLGEVRLDLRQFVLVCFGAFCLLSEQRCLVS